MEAKKYILTIEDDPTEQTFIKRTLEREGYTVYAADTGKKGIEIAQNLTVDVIILDEMLPDMTGTEVGKQLRAHERTRETPILFLTVVDTVETIFAHFDLNAVNHLTKPISAAELIRQVGAITNR